MKYPLYCFDLIVKNSDRKLYKSFKEFPYGEIKKDISYINDDNYFHKMDIFYPVNKRKAPLILNVHGGAYYLGSKDTNNIFCSYFAANDVYVVSTNYSLVNGKNDITIKDQVYEIAKCLEYIISNKESLGLDYSDIYLMGDSAGGHIVLMINLLLQNKELRKHYNVDPNFNPSIKGIILSTPMYDFESLYLLAKPILFEGGLKKVFSKFYKKEGFLHQNSPKAHLNENTKFPRLMVISSEGDVFKSQTLSLTEDLNKYKIEHYFYFENDKKAEHVFHHYHFEKKTTIDCNNAIIDFIKDIK